MEKRNHPIPHLTSPLKGEERCSRPFKGRAGVGMGFAGEVLCDSLTICPIPHPTSPLSPKGISLRGKGGGASVLPWAAHGFIGAFEVEI